MKKWGGLVLLRVMEKVEDWRCYVVSCATPSSLQHTLKCPVSTPQGPGKHQLLAAGVGSTSLEAVRPHQSVGAVKTRDALGMKCDGGGGWRQLQLP